MATAGLPSSPVSGEYCFPEEGLATGRARLLVVVPPFASPDRPSIGGHIIARVASDNGFAAEILYANLSFAALLGLRDYTRLCHAPTGHLIGERIFARAAYGDSAPAQLEEEAAGCLRGLVSDPALDLARLQNLAESWADFYAERLAQTPAQIIGFTTTFEQTLASVALIERVRRLAPLKRLIVGGANVDGAMAEGVGRLSSEIDHIFSGESEESFADFLKGIDQGIAMPRIIAGSANRALDALPAPDYASYRTQLEQTVSAERIERGLRPEDLWIPYESSRGCWWGAKHHCTFCGLNALGMGYREKKPAKVLGEITELASRNPGSRIMMVDNIMPFTYFSTLIPELARRPRGLSIFYEQKANLSLGRMRLLAEAGVSRIQPGIESLDTAVLKLMRKGSNLRTNLDCLRYARTMKVDVAWNLIVDFPYEEDSSYEAMAELIPRIFHLQPPSGLSQLSIDRFSPYFDESEAFGISNVRPIPAYAAVHPGIEDVSDVAYHFYGDYPSTFRRRPELIDSLRRSVEEWELLWKDPDTVPLLEIFELSEDRYLVCDTRPGAAAEAELVGREAARLCLTGSGSEEARQWALERGHVWPSDGRLLPLAVADEACMRQFVDV